MSFSTCCKANSPRLTPHAQTIPTKQRQKPKKMPYSQPADNMLRRPWVDGGRKHTQNVQ